jgi:hypothetical protein
MRGLLMVLPVLLVTLHQPAYCSFNSKSATSNSLKNSEVLANVEASLLSMFGFKRRPRPSKVEVPEAMLELYRKQTGFELDTTALPLPGRHTRTANTVRSFPHVGKYHSIHNAAITTRRRKLKQAHSEQFYIPRHSIVLYVENRAKIRRNMTLSSLGSKKIAWKQMISSETLQAKRRVFRRLHGFIYNYRCEKLKSYAIQVLLPASLPLFLQRCLDKLRQIKWLWSIFKELKFICKTDFCQHEAVHTVVF